MSVKRAQCPKCHQAFGILERQLGGEVYCPHCGQKIRTVAPKPVAEKPAAEDAISQLAGPSRREETEPDPFAGAMPVSDVGADPLGLGSEAPSAAPGEFQGGDVPMARPIGRPGSDTALARNLGLDEDAEPVGSLASAPVRSVAAVWIWSSLVLLGLVGVVIGIIVSKQRQDRIALANVSNSPASPNTKTRRGRPEKMKPVNVGKESERERLERSRQADAGGDDEDPVAEKDVKRPPPLKIHVFTNHTRAFGPEGEMREVLFGHVQNERGKVVRKAVLNMSAMAPKSGRIHETKSITFRDVQPEEVVWFVFEYPYFEEEAEDANMKAARKYPYAFREVTTEEKGFEFSVVTHRPQSDGANSGLIVCDVENKSSVRAGRVAVLLVFLDRYDIPAGFARADIRDLSPGAGSSREVKVRWEHCAVEDIHRVVARAQLVSPE